MTKEVNILIADDHQIVIDGLKNILTNVSGIRVAATAGNGKEAIEICTSLKIDVILMDIDMPEMDGIEATKRLKQKFSGIKILVLSMHNEKGIIQEVINAGADGYLLKNTNQTELIGAIKKVCSGEKYFSSDVTLTLINNSASNQTENNKHLVSNLTEREIEIIQLIAEGLSNKEIGDKLFISHRTVDTHRTNIMKKIDVHNVAGLIRFAINNNLV